MADSAPLHAALPLGDAEDLLDGQGHGLWARFNCNAPRHPKLLALGDIAPLAGWLWFSAICYSMEYLTDGKISHFQLRRLFPYSGFTLEGGSDPIGGVGDVTADRLIECLANVGLLELSDEGECGVQREARYFIHDYLKHQVAAKVLESQRKKNAERQTRWRSRRIVTNGVSSGVTDAVSDASPSYSMSSSTSSPKGTRKETRSRTASMTDDEFLVSLKENSAYRGLDLTVELAKIDAWLLANPRRKKTRRFVVNWLNRIERPLPAGQTPPPYFGPPAS